MKLEKAIIHAEAIAKAKEREAKENRNHGGWAYDDEAKKCSACAAEHRQLAEWLKELKERREKDVPDINVGDMISRQAVIDELKRYFHDEYYQRTSIQDCINCFIEDILTKLPSVQTEPTTEIQEILNYLDTTLHPIVSPDNWNVYAELHDMVSKLPSTQPEPQWIPVTERLPEEYGNYLISIHGEDEPDIGTINPNNKRGWSLCDASGFYWASDKSLIVTAWMPFPEPYRVERKPMGKLIDQRASAQSKKFSEVLQDMMDEDYYLFCHTGYSRLAEKDWVWLIEQVKEMEQKGRTDDCI